MKLSGHTTTINETQQKAGGLSRSDKEDYIRLSEEACTEHGQARRANTTPNGGPPVELERLGLKIWSKSDFAIALHNY